MRHNRVDTIKAILFQSVCLTSVIFLIEFIVSGLGFSNHLGRGAPSIIDAFGKGIAWTLILNLISSDGILRNRRERKVVTILPNERLPYTFSLLFIGWFVGFVWHIIVHGIEVSLSGGSNGYESLPIANAIVDGLILACVMVMIDFLMETTNLKRNSSAQQAVIYTEA